MKLRGARYRKVIRKPYFITDRVQKICTLGIKGSMYNGTIAVEYNVHFIQSKWLVWPS